MPFSPAVLQQIADEIDPACLSVPAPINVYDTMHKYHFMNEVGAIITGLPAMNHRFTVNFGVAGCNRFCEKTNLALSDMPEDWRHIVINTDPELAGMDASRRADYRKGIEHDYTDKRDKDVKNVTVLFPVKEVDNAWRIANQKAEHPKSVFQTRDGRCWILSAQEGYDITVNGFGLGANPNSTRIHNTQILTFDAQGCQTGTFTPEQIFSNEYQGKMTRGCAR